MIVRILDHLDRSLVIIAIVLALAYNGLLPTRLLSVIPYYDKIMHFLLIGAARCGSEQPCADDGGAG